MKDHHNLYIASCHYQHGYYVFQWCTNREAFKVLQSVEPAFVCNYLGASLRRFEQQLASTYLPHAEKLYIRTYRAYHLIKEKDHSDDKGRSQSISEIYNLVDVFLTGVLQNISSGLKAIFEDEAIRLSDVQEEINELMGLLHFLIKQTSSLRAVVINKNETLRDSYTDRDKCLNILDEVAIIQNSFLNDLRLLEKEISNPLNCLVLN